MVELGTYSTVFSTVRKENPLTESAVTELKKKFRSGKERIISLHTEKMNLLAWCTFLANQ